MECTYLSTYGEGVQAWANLSSLEVSSMGMDKALMLSFFLVLSFAGKVVPRTTQLSRLSALQPLTMHRLAML